MAQGHQVPARPRQPRCRTRPPARAGACPGRARAPVPRVRVGPGRSRSGTYQGPADRPLSSRHSSPRLRDRPARRLDGSAIRARGSQSRTAPDPARFGSDPCNCERLRSALCAPQAAGVAQAGATACSGDRLSSALPLRHPVLMAEEPAARRPSYEEARDELVELVKRLEAGGLTLEQSLELWERGERLAAICEEWLEGARARLAAAIGAQRPAGHDSEADDEAARPF